MKLDKTIEIMIDAYRQQKHKIFYSLIPPFFIMLSAVMINQLRGITIGFLTRDPNAIGGIPYYAGVISQIGIFFWAAAATVCFFTWYLLKRFAIQSEKRPFLLFAGLLSLILGADDVFQMHEGFFPDIGIPENIVLISYILLIVYFLINFSQQILQTNIALLFLSLIFFGLSMVVDVLFLFEPVRHLLEDGFKLFGITTWASYFTFTCIEALSLSGNQK